MYDHADVSGSRGNLVDHHGGLAAGAHIRLWIAAGDYTADGEAAWQDTTTTVSGPTLVVTWE